LPGKAYTVLGGTLNPTHTISMHHMHNCSMVNNGVKSHEE